LFEGELFGVGFLAGGFFKSIGEELVVEGWGFFAGGGIDGEEFVLVASGIDAPGEGAGV
jgi:hypothetical protein